MPGEAYSKPRKDQDILSIQYDLSSSKRLGDEIKEPKELQKKTKEETEHLDMPYFQHDVSAATASGLHIVK